MQTSDQAIAHGDMLRPDGEEEEKKTSKGGIRPDRSLALSSSWSRSLLNRPEAMRKFVLLLLYSACQPASQPAKRGLRMEQLLLDREA